MSQLSNSEILSTEFCQEISEIQGALVVGGMGLDFAPGIGAVKAEDAMASLSLGGATARTPAAAASIDYGGLFNTVMGFVNQGNQLYSNPAVISWLGGVFAPKE
jgi:hypothetical protein